MPRLLTIVFTGCALLLSVAAPASAAVSTHAAPTSITISAAKTRAGGISICHEVSWWNKIPARNKRPRLQLLTKMNEAFGLTIHCWNEMVSLVAPLRQSAATHMGQGDAYLDSLIASVDAGKLKILRRNHKLAEIAIGLWGVSKAIKAGHARVAYKRWRKQSNEFLYKPGIFFSADFLKPVEKLMGTMSQKGWLDRYFPLSSFEDCYDQIWPSEGWLNAAFASVR